MILGIGFILGLSVSLFEVNTSGFIPKYRGDFIKDLQSQWRRIYNQNHPDHSDPHSHEDMEDADTVDEVVIFHNTSESIHKDEDIIAKELSENIKVLCWVMTQPSNHVTKVRISINHDKFILMIKNFAGKACESHLGQKMQQSVVHEQQVRF